MKYEGLSLAFVSCSIPGLNSKGSCLNAPNENRKQTTLSASWLPKMQSQVFFTQLTQSLAHDFCKWTSSERGIWWQRERWTAVTTARQESITNVPTLTEASECKISSLVFSGRSVALPWLTFYAVGAGRAYACVAAVWGGTVTSPAVTAGGGGGRALPCWITAWDPSRRGCARTWTNKRHRGHHRDQTHGSERSETKGTKPRSYDITITKTPTWLNNEILIGLPTCHWNFEFNS